MCNYMLAGFSSKLVADYTELANQVLDHMQIETTDEFDESITALRALIAPQESPSLSSSLQGRIDPIKELLENPDLYVENQENFEGFRQIVRDRITSKVNELASLSLMQRDQYVNACKAREKAADEFRELISGREPPHPGDEAHVISEREWHVQLQQQVNIEDAPLHDRDRVMTMVGQDGLVYQYASADLRNDREFVLEAVRQDGRAFQYASAGLRNDREFVLEAVSQDGRAFQYASAGLRNDQEIVLAAVSQDGRALEYASAGLRNDREFVLAAVRQNGRAFQYASTGLRNDREIVLAAVSQDGWALEYASDDFNNDREIVLAGVRQNGRAFQYASTGLRNDREIVLAAVRQDGWALEYASDDLSNDREIVLAANVRM